MDWDAISLPWATLVTLASGYSGYYVANVGLRDHHKAIDITFRTLVYGFFATLAYLMVLQHDPEDGFRIVAAPVAAFLTATLLGAAWSRWGKSLLDSALRAGNVSHTGELPSAWLTMFSVTDVTGRQLAVKLKDGTWLKCEDLRDFGEAPNGPCIFGGTGDILMYVTHVKKPKAAFVAVTGVHDTEWGFEATYIPASEIARIDYRRRPTAWPSID